MSEHSVTEGPGEPVLPTFLLVGAMKCGTTSLYTALDRLPGVGFTRDKEPGFLADRALDRDALVAAYRDAYPDPTRVRGDASTDYAKFPQVRGVPERAADLLGEVPILYVVRDPIARIRSHWRHLVVSGRTGLPLEQAIVDIRRLVDVSRYATQVDAWAAHHPVERILVLHLRELTRDHTPTMERVAVHLGMDGLPPVPDELPRENARSTQLREGTLSSRVADTPWYRLRLREHIPQRVRRLVPTVLGHRGVEEFPDDMLSETVEADLRAELEPELRRLGTDYGLCYTGV